MSTTRDRKSTQARAEDDESAPRRAELASTDAAPASETPSRDSTPDPSEVLNMDELRQETREWLESLDYVYQTEGPARVQELLPRLQDRATSYGVRIHFP